MTGRHRLGVEGGLDGVAHLELRELCRVAGPYCSGHGVGTEFHRARHGHFQAGFAGTGFAGSCISVIHRAHNGLQVTINGPLTVIARLALPFSSIAVRPGPLANSVVNLSSSKRYDPAILRCGC